MNTHEERGATTGAKFERAVAIMARLRAPGGCPWDREQSFDTIKPYTLEETYEVLEAIDQRDWQELPGELGDLLLQVLFYAEMAAEESRFSIDDVLDRLADKLVARHPHVFGGVKAATAAEVLKNWDALKAQEKRLSGEASNDHEGSLLGGVSRAMPALLEAHKLSLKAAGVGFDWPDISGLFAKLQEETAELQKEIAGLPHPPQPAARSIAGSQGQPMSEAPRLRLEDELGDMLFVLVNIARYLSIDPESSLRKTNAKFRRRFAHVESEIRKTGRELSAASLDEMEAAWQRSKQAEDL